MSTDRLARFRADPSKVRVSVRRHGDEVSLCIQSRVEPLRGVDALNIPLTPGDIESAMDRLLERADGYVEGIEVRSRHNKTEIVVTGIGGHWSGSVAEWQSALLAALSAKLVEGTL